jgi:glutathione S-transferase
VYREELKKYGGKIQVPCLRIKKEGGSDEWLYESNDIIKYLENKI